MNSSSDEDYGEEFFYLFLFIVDTRKKTYRICISRWFPAREITGGIS